MFALWYLTFAVDEIRKRLAWLFGPKKPAQPAIDNKATPAAAPTPAPKSNSPPAPKPAAAPVSPPKPATPTPPVVTKPAPAAPTPTPTPVVAPKPAPAPTPTPVVAPKLTPVSPPATASKAADKMPIPLPKSLTEANNNTNGNGTNGNNYDDLDQKLFDGQLPPSKVAKVDKEQLKDASNDFIKGEANAFVQSIKEAQQAGTR
ncbi:alpha carbonic anhydrase 8-like isoform X3 [Drosophila innubila]|uniref:alpha carbonic anhydrase 8-like isoform X3 n=1 Tax=Drosophila innubila TaxID=198719 RepID=UPI00148BA78C|nr:alpha carbonic anhydrase 8-like isoform X3 [Drosophila innubila]